MSVFERRSPKSPYWFVQFTHQGIPVRKSSRVLIGATKAEQKESFAKAVELEKKWRGEIDARLKGGFSQITLQQAMQDHFDEGIRWPARRRRQEAWRRSQCDQGREEFSPDMRRLYAASARTGCRDITSNMVREWRNSTPKGGEGRHQGQGWRRQTVLHGGA
jgi:hypothetical protein